MWNMALESSGNVTEEEAIPSMEVAAQHLR